MGCKWTKNPYPEEGYVVHGSVILEDGTELFLHCRVSGV